MPLTAKRLKRLTAYRERLEKLQEQELAKVVASRQARIDALARSQADRHAALVTRSDRGEIDPTLLDATQRYLVRMSREVSAREAALRHSDAEVAAEREFLLERSRDRKAMESLLDRRVAIERADARRLEAIALDEVAVTRWQTGRNEGATP